MQGNERNRNEIDEQFVSEAWASMSAMLDKELPIGTKPPKREGKRYFLLLLLLLIGVGIGIASATLYYKNIPPQKQEETKPKVPVKQAPVAAVLPGEGGSQSQSENQSQSEVRALEERSEDVVTVDALEEADVVVAKKELEVVGQSNRALELKTTQMAVANSILTSPVPDKSIPSAINHVETPQVDDSALNPIAPIAAHLESPKPELPKKEIGSIKTPTINHQHTSSTDLKPIALLGGLLVHSALMETMTPSELKKKSRWNVALRATSIRDNGTQQFSGWSGGLVLEYQLGYARFSLQSGLSFHRLVKSRSAITDGITTVNPESYVAPIINATDYDKDGSVTAFTLADAVNFNFPTASLKNMNYLKVPLGLSFKFNRRFRVTTGINAGVLLSKIGDKQNTLTSASFLDPNTQSGKRTIGNQYVLDGLKTFDMGMHVGVSYYPIKRLGIELNYNNGLRDFTNNEHFGFVQSHTNQYLQLGLSYYLTNH